MGRRGHYRVLHNKGDISFTMSHAGKVSLKVVAKRLSQYCEAKGLTVAVGAVRVSTGSLDQDMMFMGRRLQEIGRTGRICLSVCFIDLRRSPSISTRCSTPLTAPCCGRYSLASELPPQMIAVIQQFHDGMSEIELACDLVTASVRGGTRTTTRIPAIPAFVQHI